MHGASGGFLAKERTDAQEFTIQSSDLRSFLRVSWGPGTMRCRFQMFEQESKAIFSQSVVNRSKIDEYGDLTLQSPKDLTVVLTGWHRDGTTSHVKRPTVTS